MQKILDAAGVVLDGALAVLKFAKKFTEKNTPESALILALAATYQGYATGQLPAGAAIVMAVTALTTFVITESAKDSAQTTTNNAPPATP